MLSRKTHGMEASSRSITDVMEVNKKEFTIRRVACTSMIANRKK